MSNKKQVCLELTTAQDDERPVFVSGSFCEWLPDVAKFEMTRVGNGKYTFTFGPEWQQTGQLEYKYTRGGWDHVELDTYGNPGGNRLIEPKQSRVKDFVPYWRNFGSTPSIKRLMPYAELISEAFHIPQLDRSRKVNVLLPHDYYDRPDKQYPVLYMQDAQNLYGEGSSYGNWEIDKRLSLLASRGKGDVIVVAVDHGEEDRFVEYSPYKSVQKGKGKGMKYANFIARTLKPYVDNHFRTLKGRQDTGIGGSSMGGLISIYAGFMYPETFGRLMVFSPSLWVSNKIYFDAVEFFNPIDTRIYLYAGGKESKYMVPNVSNLKKTIENQGFDASKLQVKVSVDPIGEHKEKRWGEEFPKAIEWMFFS